jgi:pimeloyl-ACP methyl ester carboxylesterase
MMSEDLSFELPDGRHLSYTTFGAPISPNQSVIFYFHGFPGTHSEGLPVHETASKRGVVVVGVTRPGFGDSTAQPGRALSSFPPDVLHLADHLGVQKFAILGISGGGPYALACLRHLPAERLRSVTVVSGMWPTALGTAGMMPQMRVMYTLASWVPGFVNWMVGMELNAAAQDTEHPEKFEELMAKGFQRWPAEDQEVIFREDGKLFKVLSRSSREAIKHGTGGFGTEAQIFGRPWDFQLEDLPIDGRLEVWHGAKDRNVPITMADQAVELMPGVEYHRFEEEAHLTLSMKHLDEILDSLLSKLEN